MGKALGRVLVLSLALCQAGAPALVAFADAPSAARGVSASHVEEQTRRSCVPAHPDECALCRALSFTGEPAGSGETVGALLTASASRGLHRMAPPQSDVSGGLRSRAPPAV